MEKRSNPDLHDDRPKSEFSGKLLGRLALMAGSALFGGFAVALWSRRSLQRIQESVDRGLAEQSATDPDSLDDE
jgi:hypothetical protein